VAAALRDNLFAKREIEGEKNVQVWENHSQIFGHLLVYLQIFETFLFFVVVYSGQQFCQYAPKNYVDKC
jgi:hypothetical protein